jgi:hypothetical protein
MHTAYVRYTKKGQSRIEVYELRSSTNFRHTLRHLELILDDWRLDESFSLSTDLKKYKDIIPQYSK